MKTFNRFCWFALLIGIIIVIMTSLTSCGSKKKLTQKTQFSTEVATVERITEKSETETKTDVSTTETSKETTTTKDDNFQGEIADPSKPATITTEEKDGKKTTTYTNFKNIKTGEQNYESETNKTFGQNLSKIDLSKTDLSKKKQTKNKTENKTTSKDLKVERGFPWWILVLIGLVWLVVSYLKKTFLPWKWL